MYFLYNFTNHIIINLTLLKEQMGTYIPKDLIIFKLKLLRSTETAQE